MSIMNDLKRSFLNASKIIVDKTGDYSRIARLALENKKYESDIEKKQTDAGRYVFDHMQNGDSTIDLKTKELTDALEEIRKLEEKIAVNKEEIEQLKKSQKTEEETGNTDNGNTE